MDDDRKEQPESLLPYERWTEQALRQVVAQAIEHAAAEGLPGGHHFYVSFRTDFPGVVIPQRVRAQYPREMTIVLQHQFWDLAYDREDCTITVGLSFGGVPSTLTIPLDAVIEFADPHIRYGLRFTPPDAEQVPDAEPEAIESKAGEPAAPTEPAQVVSLDAFRRRTPQG
jgi:hypothetical protein